MTKLIRFLTLILLPFFLISCSLNLPATATPTLEPTPLPTATQIQHTEQSYSYNQEEVTSPSPDEVHRMTDMAGFENLFATADLFTLTLEDVAPAPDSQVYQAWLVSNDGLYLNMGTITPDENGILQLDWTSPSGENLLARYFGSQITLEPASGSEKPTGEPVYQGQLDSDQISMAQLLFVSTSSGQVATPLSTPLIPGLLTQHGIAIQHIINAQNAQSIGADRETNLHLEHVINILEGSEGDRFLDYDGDGAAHNPGDGFGVKGYTIETANVIGAPELAQVIVDQVNSLQDQALAIIEMEDRTDVAEILAELLADAEALRDGAITDLYQQADKAVWFAIK